MAGTLTPMIDALLPVILLMSLGYVSRRFLMTEDSEWDDLHKLTYYVLMPALILSRLAEMRQSGVSSLAVGVVMCSAQMVMFGMTFFALTNPETRGARFSALLQNNILTNGYVALTVADAYFGRVGAAVAMTAAAVTVPAAHLLGLWAVHVWGDPDGEETLRPSGVLRSTPAIACLLGLWLQRLHVSAPLPVQNTLNMLGDAAIPLGLLAAGAGLAPLSMRDCPSETWTWILVRATAFPALTLLFCKIFGIDDVLVIGACMITAAAPTAAWGYITARRFGGDAPFSAVLIVANTFVSLISMPRFVWLFFKYGVKP